MRNVMVSTLDQIQKLQQQLQEEMECLELLQANDTLRKAMEQHKNCRVHPMLKKPLYGCVAWVTFKGDREFVLNALPSLVEQAIGNLSGSGFWRYASVPDLQASIDKVKEEDSKLIAFYRKTEGYSETSLSGTKIGFYIMVGNYPVKIYVDFSYNSRNGYKVPYLIENRFFVKNGLKGKKYKGINGADDHNECTNLYKYGDINDLLPEFVGE